MALLEDPTIQRILDEVNKAATGGIFGRAGNYIPSPTKAEPFHVPAPADDEPMFYPTPEMFTGVDFNPLVPLGAPSNFDFYGEALYKTMPTNVLSPYETTFNQSQMRTTSIVSSTNNDVLSDAHRHFEYPTVPPKITGAVPNLGLNLRATPPSDPLPSKTTHELSSAEPLDTATASIDFPSLPPNENEEIDPPHICKLALRPLFSRLDFVRSFSFGRPNFLRSESANRSTQRLEFGHVQTEHHRSLSPTAADSQRRSAGDQRSERRTAAFLLSTVRFASGQFATTGASPTAGDQT